MIKLFAFLRSLFLFGCHYTQFKITVYHQKWTQFWTQFSISNFLLMAVINIEWGNAFKPVIKRISV